MRIRVAEAADATAICAVERAAFGRDDEAELVERLRAADALVAELVAESDRGVVGHVAFSRMSVAPVGLARVAALAPLAVDPDAQRRGVGAALVEGGLEALGATGEDAVIVLGDPAYYGRFGFSAAILAAVAAPFAGPAFQGLELRPRALAGVDRVGYPAAFGVG